MNLPGHLPQRHRFFQFSLRQAFVLLAAVGLLLAIISPALHRAGRERQFQTAVRRAQQAQRDLILAVQENDVKLAYTAIHRGARASQVVGAGPSFLHLSIVEGNITMMELLLDAGADIERYDSSQRFGRELYGRPLHVAIACSQPLRVRLAIVRSLVERGADVHSEANRRNGMDFAVAASDASMGDLLREYGLPYGPREMAAFGRLNELAASVKQNPKLLRQRFRPIYAARPGEGPTLLGLALERGYTDMCEFLIQSGAPLDTTENRGQTPLHLAARSGHPELIRRLAAQGLDVNARDDFGDTPLADIAGGGNSEVIATLIALGADVNTRGMNQLTPLHRAVSNNYEPVIRMLVAAGADPMIPDRTGETPLAAAQRKHLAIGKLLEEAAAGARHVEPE